MLIGYCPECHKAGLRRSWPPSKTDWLKIMDGQRLCPRCRKWVTPIYLGNAERKVAKHD